MTPREYCLARVLTENEVRGPVVVLKCADVADDAARQEYARLISTRHLIRPSGTNTRGEAESVHADFTERDLTLVTSAYHQLRAFLTFVAVFGMGKTRIWNAPAPSSMDKLNEEMQKINEYSQHVASYRYGVTYLKWRDAQ